jgi:hypothetical protein
MTGNRRVGSVAVVVALVIIGGTTLQPIPSQAIHSAATPFFCFPCGDAGVADFILNVLLFVPLGFSLGLLGLACSTAIGISLALTGAIEALQYIAIMGRDASMADIAANGLGGTLGWFIVSSRWHRLLTLRELPRAAFGVSLALVVAATGMTVALIQPSLPGGTWYGQWAIDPPEEGWFTGKVIHAELGNQRLPHWRIPDSERRHRDLGNGAIRLSAMVVSGDPSEEGARILSLATGTTRFLSMGQRGRDLTFGVRLKASDLWLHSPRFRAPGLLPAVAGDTVALTGVLDRGVASLSVETKDQEKHFQVRLSAFDGWTLFAPVPLSGAPIVFMLTLGWIAALFLPVGWFSVSQSTRRFSYSLVALLAAIAVGSLVGGVPLPRPLFMGVGVAWALLGRSGGAWTLSRRGATGRSDVV